MQIKSIFFPVSWHDNLDWRSQLYYFRENDKDKLIHYDNDHHVPLRCTGQILDLDLFYLKFHIQL